MKILVVNDKFPPDQTTVGTIARDLSEGFKKSGHNVLVFTTRSNQNSPLVAISNSNIPIFSIPRRETGHFLRFYKLLFNPVIGQVFKEIINKEKPDIVFFHNIHQYLSFSLLKIAKKSGAKVFLVAHDAMLYSQGKVFDDSKISQAQLIKEYGYRFNPFRNSVIKFYLKYVNKVVSVSEALRRALQNNGIKNVAVVYNGLNLEKWEVSEAQVAEFKRKHALFNKKVVLFAGRLSTAKGGSNILEIMAEVVKKCPTAVLVAAGNRDKYACEMLDSAKKAGLKDNFILTGWLNGFERVAAYNASDIVVFPSIYNDPFGMVNIEAMASKKPVVATSFGGASEIIENGLTGYIANPFNVEEFSKNIITLLSNSDLASNFGNAGYERLKNMFTLQHQVNAYLDLFKAF